MPYFKVKIEGVSDSTGKTIVHSDVYQSKDASALAELIRQELDLDRDKNPNSVYIEFLRDDEPVDDASWGMSSEGLNVGCDFASGVCLSDDRAIWQLLRHDNDKGEWVHMPQRYDDDIIVPIPTEWGYL